MGSVIPHLLSGMVVTRPEMTKTLEEDYKVLLKEVEGGTLQALLDRILLK